MYEDREEVLKRTAAAIASKPTKGRSDARHLHVVWKNFQDVFPTWLDFLIYVAGNAPKKGIRIVADTLARH